MTETADGALVESVLAELKSIRKLLVTSLLLSGMDANLLASILGYKSKSSITNYFPVERIQECANERLDRLVAKLGDVREQLAVRKPR